MPNQLPVNYRNFLRSINEAGVRFVVIGGVAMILHGTDTLTRDMDISFARDRKNTDALAKVLAVQKARFRDFPPDLPFILDGQMLRNSATLTLETKIGDFDLLAEPEGVDGFEGLWERAVIMEIDGSSVRVAAVPDLIAMKRAADRPKDRLHIMELQALTEVQGENA